MMKKIKVKTTFHPENVGFIAFVSLVISLIFSGKKKRKRKSFSKRYMKNYKRVLGTTTHIYNQKIKADVNKSNENDMTVDEAIEKYNNSIGKTVIEYEEKNGKKTLKYSIKP